MKLNTVALCQIQSQRSRYLDNEQQLQNLIEQEQLSGAKIFLCALTALTGTSSTLELQYSENRSLMIEAINQLTRLSQEKNIAIVFGGLEEKKGLWQIVPTLAQNGHVKSFEKCENIQGIQTSIGFNPKAELNIIFRSLEAMTPDVVAFPVGQAYAFIGDVYLEGTHIYKGGARLVDAQGNTVIRLENFKTQCASGNHPINVSAMMGPALKYQAATQAIRSYVQACGFKGVVLGLSGGADSALVLSMAVDALGKDKVHAFALPSAFNSHESLKDAKELTENFGVSLHELSIEKLFNDFCFSLNPIFDGLSWDSTEENIQARIRGVLLMALSNKFSWMLLSTSNKSESAVGYSTLYGDSAGALAPIADLYKTEVWELMRWRNREKICIPMRIIEKAPSAELRPDQLDQDSLPPYDVLDRLIEAILLGQEVNEISKTQGLDIELIHRIGNMMARSVFKRSQVPSVVQLSYSPLSRFDERLSSTCSKLFFR